MRLSDNNTSSGSACILGLFIGLFIMWCHAKRITCVCVRPICGYGIFEFQFVNDDGLPHAGLLDSLDIGISSAYEVRLMKSDGISSSISRCLRCRS